MARKPKVPQEPEAREATPEVPQAPERLRRRMVLVGEADLQRIREAFAAKQPVNVTVHPQEQQELTDEQRLRRKAYRQRPEVREKQKAYRQRRAKRLREEKRQSETLRTGAVVAEAPMPKAAEPQS